MSQFAQLRKVLPDGTIRFNDLNLLAHGFMPGDLVYVDVYQQAESTESPIQYVLRLNTSASPAPAHSPHHTGRADCTGTHEGTPTTCENTTPKESPQTLLEFQSAAWLPFRTQGTGSCAADHETHDDASKKDIHIQLPTLDHLFDLMEWLEDSHLTDAWNIKVEVTA